MRKLKDVKRRLVPVKHNIFVHKTEVNNLLSLRKFNALHSVLWKFQETGLELERLNLETCFLISSERDGQNYDVSWKSNWFLVYLLRWK